MKTRNVEQQFWRSPSVKDVLSPYDKLIWLYCKTGPASTVCGLYKFSFEDAHDETGLDLATIQKCLRRLEKPQADGQSHIRFDWKRRIIWIVKALEREFKAGKLGDRVEAGVVNVINGLEPCEIVVEFCRYYEKLGGTFTELLDRVSNRVSDRVSHTLYRDISNKSKELRAKRKEEPGNGKDSDQTAQDILAWLNTKAAKNFRPTDTNLTFIRARLHDGILPGQLKAIVSRKVREWKPDPKMEKYLRPATLFNREKCEQYVGELPPIEEAGNESPVS